MLEKAASWRPAMRRRTISWAWRTTAAAAIPEAVAEFEKTVRLRPSDARALDYLALNLEPMGEIQRAGQPTKGLAVNLGTVCGCFPRLQLRRLLLKLDRLAESKEAFGPRVATCTQNARRF